MAVREFSDGAGQRWRAWDITPESIHPQTKAEDYLADCYREGWVVFENLDTGEKRRLCPFPLGWQSLSDAALEGLLAKDAEPVRPTRRFPTAGLSAPPSAPADAARPLGLGEVDLGELGVVRTFLYPGGRVWAVCVIAHPEEGGPPVLRFQSGLRHIDLARWPADWADRGDTELAALLRAAAPRTASWHEGLPRRRYDDVESAPDAPL